jgi:hypothetical protein
MKVKNVLRLDNESCYANSTKLWQSFSARFGFGVVAEAVVPAVYSIQIKSIFYTYL